MTHEEMREYLEGVPADWQPRFKELMALTEPFCDAHLNDEYRVLIREMAVVVCQEDSPVRRGKAAGWAAGIVYSVGWVNFLTNPESQPHVTSNEIAYGFNVGESTMMSKARVLREGLQLRRLDPDWCLESRLGDNPLVWIQEVNGLMIDLRHAPRDVQQQAYDAGRIPFVYADRQVDAGDPPILGRIEPGGEVAHPPRLAPDGSLFSPENVAAAVEMLAQRTVPAPPDRKPRTTPALAYTLKITLHRTKPPIWRKVAVLGDIKLSKLHDVIQIAMGWYDCHLHQFVGPSGDRFGLDDPDLDMDVINENRYRLHDIVDTEKARFMYEYDFGDGWEHRIEVMKIEEPKTDLRYPVCLGGKRACPPEDCGGIYGFYDMLAAIDDPQHEMHETFREWLDPDYDPEVFDLDGVNRQLRRLQPRKRK